VKIYTRTGDQGDTGLYGGSRIRKDALRVEAYGSLDELNAALGAALAVLGQNANAVSELLVGIQSVLFDIGAELATPVEREGTALTRRLHGVVAAQTEALEGAIDVFEAQLPPLKSFILPGGTQAASTLHLARTIARRAERRVVSLNSQEPVNPEILRYLNRLSDLLFVLARTANRLAGVQEREWKS
jgi:cob(I)alamin adenosyltransferase